MVDDLAAADEERDHQRHAEDEFERGPEHGHEAGEQEAAADVLAVGLFEGLDLGLFLREGADEARAGEVFFCLRGDVGEHGLDAFEAGVNAGAEELYENGREGQGQEGEEREPRAHADHEGQGRRGEDDGVGRVHDGWPEKLTNGRKVVGRAGHDVAGAVAVEVGGRLALKLGEDVVAEVELDLARGTDDDLPGEVEADGRDDGDAQKFERVLPDGGGVDVATDVVDGGADEQRNGGFGAVVDQQRQPAQREAPPIAAKVRKERAEALKHGG